MDNNTAAATTVEVIINRSFLSRVPEIMERGGFTLETAMDQAFREDNDLCLELEEGRSERARAIISGLSNVVYSRLREKR